MEVRVESHRSSFEIASSRKGGFEARGKERHGSMVFEPYPPSALAQRSPAAADDTRHDATATSRADDLSCSRRHGAIDYD
ncbi:hypothetical protein EVAR_89048_1 [Eumeta japonica]|uniref:Uncharacterized protein n=1 Tax=Eumeta variegata TaxID=151549 RepID=A0A4C1Z323_EUMVA|nr:hypothetical protein EVAR_89048_1 [Eumeta japonica]